MTTDRHISFISVKNTVMGLPPQYKEGWVAINVKDRESSSLNLTMPIVIKKDESDSVFTLKNNDKIEIFASAVSGNLRSAISSRSQSNVVLEVHKIKKIE